MSFITQFTTDSHHVSGEDNVVELLPVMTNALAGAQKTDVELQHLLEGNSSLQLQ